MHIIHFAIFFSFVSSCFSELTDESALCAYWAESGECIANPGYMLESCAKSCARAMVQPPESFYVISEKDILGNVINYKDFIGKVVYVVNVASHCGYTADNYNLLKKLSAYRSDQFEILIFPCNQFGLQEPGSPTDIEQFARGRGFEGIIMGKGDVNGNDVRPTFRFLKSKTPSKTIGWNFDGKYIVDRNGNVHLPGDDVEADILSFIPNIEF